MPASFRSVIATSLFALCAFATTAPAATVIHLASTPETVHRGILSPDIAPVLHIKSGDTVEIGASRGIRVTSANVVQTSGWRSYAVFVDEHAKWSTTENAMVLNADQILARGARAAPLRCRQIRQWQIDVPLQSRHGRHPGGGGSRRD